MNRSVFAGTFPENIKHVAFIILLALSLTTLFSCGAIAPSGQLTLFAMDTLLEIETSEELSETAEQTLRAQVTRLENQLSVTIAASEVAGFNASLSEAPLSPDTAQIVSFALKIYRLSGGAFDITVGPLVERWDIAHPDDDWKPLGANDVASLLAHVGSDKLTLTEDENGYLLSKSDPEVEIDLGGIGKGWAAGALAESLSELSEDYAILSFGGNVALVGEKADGKDFNVGLKNPFDPQTLIGTLSVPGGIIAVSGGYERYVDYENVRYPHILDPRTGYPSDSDLASAAVWVNAITPEAGALSDAVSTALYVLGSEQSLALLESGVLEAEFGYEFGAVLIKTDGEMITTANLADRYINS